MPLDQRAKTTAPTETVDIDRHLPALIAILGGKLSRHALREFGRGVDLDFRQWRALHILGHDGPSTIIHVANRLAMDQGGVSRAIASLEKRGLVERRADAHDRRKSIVSLTPGGIEMHEKTAAYSNARERRLLKPLSAKDQKHLKKMLCVLIDELDVMIEEEWRP